MKERDNQSEHPADFALARRKGSLPKRGFGAAIAGVGASFAAIPLMASAIEISLPAGLLAAAGVVTSVFVAPALIGAGLIFGGAAMMFHRRQPRPARA